jgi:hypothetical protein
MTKAILHIVTKDPQIEQISSNVCQTAMHEHGREQGEIDGRWPRHLRHRNLLTSHIQDRGLHQIHAARDLCGYRTLPIREIRMKPLIDKESHICPKENVRHIDRAGDLAVVV